MIDSPDMTSKILYGATTTTKHIITPVIPKTKEPRLKTLLVPSLIVFDKNFSIVEVYNIFIKNDLNKKFNFKFKKNYFYMYT